MVVAGWQTPSPLQFRDGVRVGFVVLVGHIAGAQTVLVLYSRQAPLPSQ